MECVVLNSFAETLGVEVYTDDIEYISIEKLKSTLEKYCGTVTIKEQSMEVIIIYFHDYKLEDDEILKVGLSVRNAIPNMEKLEKAFNQSWIYPVAKSKVRRSNTTLTIGEINGSNMEYFKRLYVFQRTVYSIVRNISSIAIYWPLTQQIIDGEFYFNNKPESKYYDILMGAFNIRLFKVCGSENELLVDTLGLGALGLVDMQCRFKNIEPQVVSNVLCSYAYYMYENGNIMNDGDIIRGITPGNRWICNRSVSVLEPKRVVLNIIELKNLK